MMLTEMRSWRTTAPCCLRKFADAIAMVGDFGSQSHVAAKNAACGRFIDPGTLRLPVSTVGTRIARPSQQCSRASHQNCLSIAVSSSGVNRLGFRRRLQRFCLKDLAALLNDVEAVYVQILQLIDLPAQPANLHHVNLGGLLQTKVHAHIILRKVAAATAKFIHLDQRFLGARDRLGRNDDATADAGAIGFHPDKLDLDPVPIER